MQRKKKIYIAAGAIALIILLSSRKMSAAAETLIRKFEADNDVKRYLKAYQDSAGVWTLGWGSIWHYDLKRRVQPGDQIDEATALRYMKTELASLIPKIRAFIKVPINSNEEGALISLAYNIGPTGLANSTLIRLLNEGKPRTLVADEFLKWNKITDPVTKQKVALQGLTNRRIAEKALFLKPV
jgi:lysozyme